MNYNEKLKEFNKVAPEFLKAFGFGEDEITNCLNEVMDENTKKDNIISKLKEKYSLSVYRDDFPVMIYKVKNKNIYVEYDCSKWILVYKEEYFNRSSFDPCDEDCLENISNHIDNLINNIKI